MNNYFSKNLKHFRIQNGMTQKELAKKINKDYSTIGKWELDQRSPIMSDTIKIADIFNVSLETLIGENCFEDNNKKFDELDILFNKNKDILTEEDKEYIRFIVEKRKKEIDKDLGEE